MSGEMVYTGLAEFGRIRMTIGLVFAVIICTALIVLGFYDIFLDPVQLVATIASQDKNTYSIEYVYNGVTYKSTLIIDNPVSKTVTIWINPTNPHLCSISRDEVVQKDRALGWQLVGIGAFVLIISSLFYYLTIKSKAFAAFEGASGVINVFR